MTEATVHIHAHTRLRANQIGLWLFIASETFLFGAAISARYILLGVQRSEHLNQTLGFAISIVLLLSSLSAYRAETAIAHGDRRACIRNLTATVTLGLLFLVGVVFEWKEGLEFFPPSSAFGTAFFTLIGMHAFHVLTGVGSLAVVLRLVRRGRYGSGDYWPVEGVIKYWHFVDVAWVAIFPTLYLVS